MKSRLALVVVSLALSVIIGLTLAKPAGEKKAGRKPIIGVSFDTLKEERWERDRQIFVKRAEELGAEVRFLGANGINTVQMQNVTSLISQGVDCMVIVPKDGEAMAKAVEECRKAGIPVIAYDRLIVNCDLDLYMTFDNIKVGELQARYLLENLPGGKGKIVRIYGAPTDNNASMFKQGQDNVLQPAIDRGDIEVLHADWAEDWKPENGKKIMAAALTTHGDAIQGVLASNDGTAGGAIQALIEQGLAGKIIVTGQDADLAACQRIWQGTQTMTVYKPLQQLAGKAAEVATSLAKREPVIARGSVQNGRREVPSIFLEIQAVDKKNIEATVVKDGFHTLESLKGQ